jgi:hypothetical protein
VQQESRTDVTGQVLNLANIPDDSFKATSPDHLLPKLARATWKSPAPSDTDEANMRAYSMLRDPGSLLRRDTSEYPSLWAPALVYRDFLMSGDAGPLPRYAHLGLLWIALMKWGDHQARPPIHEFHVDSMKGLSPAFRDAIRSTCPLNGETYSRAVSTRGSIYALHSGNPATGPTQDDILGFFYPDTVIVPVPGLSDRQSKELYDNGLHVAGRGFPGFLIERCRNVWVSTLMDSGVPNAGDRGTEFVTFLESFDDPTHGDRPSTDEMHSIFPFDDASPWIHHLYARREN